MAEKIKSIRIHPGIGIARLGTSDEFYIGPETRALSSIPAGAMVPDQTVEPTAIVTRD